MTNIDSVDPMIREHLEYNVDVGEHLDSNVRYW